MRVTSDTALRTSYPAADVADVTETQSSGTTTRASSSRTSEDGMDDPCSDPLGLNDPMYLAQKRLAEQLAQSSRDASDRFQRDLAERIRAQHIPIA